MPVNERADGDVTSAHTPTSGIYGCCLTASFLSGWVAATFESAPTESGSSMSISRSGRHSSVTVVR